MRINVVFRMERQDLITLDQLAHTMGVDRSNLIRKAINAFLSEYTGEPDINSMEKRLRTLESRLNELNTKMEAKTNAI